jgi:hypothetical protein
MTWPPSTLLPGARQKNDPNPPADMNAVVAWLNELKATLGTGNLTASMTDLVARLAAVDSSLADLTSRVRTLETTTILPPNDPGLFVANFDPIKMPIPSNAVWTDYQILRTLNADGTGGRREFWFECMPNGNCAKVYTGTSADQPWSANVPNFEGRLAQTLPLFIPAGASPNIGADKALTIINNNIAYDFWNVTNFNTTARTFNCGAWACCYIDGSPGGVLPGKNYWVASKSTGDGPIAGQDFTSGKTGGARACNINWAAGCVSRSDLTTGVINHALVVATPANMRAAASVNPFTGYETSGPPTGPIENGARIGIPAASARPAGLTPIGNMVFDALKKFGAYLVDGTGAPQICFFTDGGQNAVNESEVDSLFAWWNTGGAGTEDLGRMQSLLRVTRSY